MPRLIFTQQLRRFTAVPEVDSDATTLRAALEAAFAVNPQLRGYLLDDQAGLRRHVAVFVDGRRCRGDGVLDAPLAAASTVHLMQALSGG